MASIFKLILEYLDGGGQYAANVLHYESDDLAGNDEWTTAADLISAWDTACTTNLRACLSSDCKLSNIRAERVAPTGGPENFQVSGAIGTGPTTMGSGSCGAQFRWIPSGTAIRPGRTTLPSPPSTWIIQDAIVSAYRVAATNLGALMIGPMVGGSGNTYKLAVYQRKTKTWADVVHGLVNIKIGVQRRRLLRQQ